MTIHLGEHYLLAKTETTPYTEEAPAGSNAIEAYDIQITPLTGNTYDRSRNARGFVGSGEMIMTERRAAITFKVAAGNSGTAGTAPGFGPLLKACYMSETIGAGVSVTYAPAVSNAPCTIYYDIGNGASTTRHKLIGCGGSVNWVEQRNSEGYFEFSMEGTYTRPAEATEVTPVLTAFNIGLPWDDANVGTFTLGGFAAKCINFSVNFGPVFVRHNVANLDQISFSDRQVRGSMTVFGEELDTKNYFTLADPLGSATTGALSVIRGSTAGYIETFTADKVQVSNIQQGNLDGLLTYSMDLAFIPTSGNDEFELVYT